METELMPCPVCGKRARIDYQFGPFIVYSLSYDCPFCGGYLYETESAEAAVKAWNEKVEKRNE